MVSEALKPVRNRINLSIFEVNYFGDKLGVKSEVSSSAQRAMGSNNCEVIKWYIKLHHNK
jgi:hypothetical protein